MASQLPAKKNTAFNLGLTLYTSTGGFIGAPTAVTAQVSKDFGAWNAVGESSIVSTIYGQIKLALNSSEMNADLVMLYVTDTGTANCMPFTASIYTAGQTLDELSTTIQAESTRISTAIYGESARLSTTVQAESTRLSTLVQARSSAVNVASFDATPLLQLGVVGQGTAQQSSSNSLTLASTMVYATDEINGATLLVTGGTGVGQARTVLSYNSTSKLATVDAYVTTPSSLATYLLFGTPPSSPTSPLVANVTQWNGAAVATPTQAGVPEVDLTYIGGVAQASTSAQFGAHVVSAASTAVTASVDSTVVADAVHNSTIDGGVTFRQMQRGFGAVLLGLVSGSSGSTTVFRDINDAKTRITAITDSNGNRTSITLDLT